MPAITDKIGFPLDVDGDLDIFRFAQATGGWTTGLEAAADGIRARLQGVRGEWFVDTALGLPWFEGDNVIATEAIIGQRYNEPYIRGLISGAILDTPGVSEILSLELAFDGRTRILTASWKARCAFGIAEGVTEVG